MIAMGTLTLAIRVVNVIPLLILAGSTATGMVRAVKESMSNRDLCKLSLKSGSSATIRQTKQLWNVATLTVRT